MSWWWNGWYAHNWQLDLAVTGIKPFPDKNPLKGSLVTVEARDKLVMPVTLRVTFADGTTRDMKLPAETWIRQASTDVPVVCNSPVVRAVLDPDHKIPDKDRTNNELRERTSRLIRERPLPASAAAMASTAAASAREILTGLHDIMAKRGSAQSKLDRVVDLIAEAMNSDVCSIYLLRDNDLELFATHGLRKEAVHVTQAADGRGPGRHDRRRRPHPQPRRGGRASRPSPTAPRPARSASTASPECRSSASKARSACSPSRTPSRAATRMSRSRRCRPSRWCCRR